MWSLRWVLVASLACAGCVDDQLVACGQDLCPRGDVCDTVHGGCVTSEQTTACADLVDGDACFTSDVIGYCLDQICIEPRCGNHVIDPGEMCDDGNAQALDGCNADCTSTERCGNGYRDPRETCDDSNFLNHDGCDSVCGLETVQWTIDGMEPNPGNLFGETVWDPDIGAIVALVPGETEGDCTVASMLWAWRGDHWTVEGLDGPLMCGWFSLVYDSTRHRLVALGIPLDGQRVEQVAEYDAATRSWTMHTVQNAPTLRSLSAAYDAAHQRIVIVGATMMPSVGRVWQLDTETWAWSEVTSASALDPDVHYIAYDAARARIVVFGESPFQARELDGGTWTTVPAPWPYRSATVNYDPSVGAIVIASADENSSATAKWTGSAWESLPPLPTNVAPSVLLYDAVANERYAFVFDDINVETSVYANRPSTTAWSRVPFNLPSSLTPETFAYDIARDRLVRFNGRETWVWTPTERWRRLDFGGLQYGPYATNYPSAIAYDPVRGGVVSSASGYGTWLLGDATWTPIQAPGMTPD